MPPDDLRRLCCAAWGTDWQSPLSRAIGRSLRTVARWASGATTMSEADATAVRRAALDAGRDLETRAREVAHLAG